MTGYYSQVPFLRRTYLTAKLLLWHSLVQTLIRLKRKFGNYPRRNLELSYPRSSLPSPLWSHNTIDVFYPKGYTGSSKHPLYIDIHGGGFTIGDPSDDAHFCRYVADAVDCVVVSLPYRKSPFHQFPKAIYDLEALILNILDDPRLAGTIDKTRVAIGGFSAGGNFSTAISTLPRIRDKVQTIVPVYPVLNFTVPVDIKLASRPDTAGVDALQNLAAMFDNGYIHYKQDRSHPLISPYYAEAKDLPENIYIIGAEYDLLNHDATEFVEKFGPHKKNLKYEMVKEMKHGYTHMYERESDEQMKAKMEKATLETFANISSWLRDVWHVQASNTQTKLPGQVDGQAL